MMAKRHRLRRLQMREAGHQQCCVFFGLIEKSALQILECGIDSVNRIAQPEAEIRRHLIVARTRGVEASGGIADQILQPRFDIHMHVFERAGKCECAAFDFVSGFYRGLWRYSARPSR